MNRDSCVRVGSCARKDRHFLAPSPKDAPLTVNAVTAPNPRVPLGLRYRSPVRGTKAPGESGWVQGGAGQTQGEPGLIALPDPSEDVLLEKKGKGLCPQASGTNPKRPQ